MEKIVIMCRSISYAQRGERLLERSNISASIVKAPQSVTSEGCSYGLRVGEKNKGKAIVILKNSGIRIGRIFKLESDGSFVEVEQ